MVLRPTCNLLLFRKHSSQGHKLLEWEIKSPDTLSWKKKMLIQAMLVIILPSRRVPLRMGNKPGRLSGCLWRGPIMTSRQHREGFYWITAFIVFVQLFKTCPLDLFFSSFFLVSFFHPRSGVAVTPYYSTQCCPCMQMVL